MKGSKQVGAREIVEFDGILDWSHISRDDSSIESESSPQVIVEEASGIAKQPPIANLNNPNK